MAALEGTLAPSRSNSSLSARRPTVGARRLQRIYRAHDGLTVILRPYFLHATDPMKACRTEFRVLLPDQFEITPRNPRHHHQDRPVRLKLWIELRKFRLPLEGLEPMGSRRCLDLLTCDIAKLS